MSRFLRLCRLCGVLLLDAFCVETWSWRGHSAVLLLALLPDDRSPPPRGSAPRMQSWAVVPPVSHHPLCPCRVTCHSAVSPRKKKRHLRDLPNFPRYISHKFLFKIQEPGGMRLEKSFHAQAKGKLPFCLSSPTGSKEHCCLAFCRFKADLSALIAVFQLHMGNRETEKSSQIYD